MYDMQSSNRPLDEKKRVCSESVEIEEIMEK